jgi:VWFA-related protein
VQATPQLFRSDVRLVIVPVRVFDKRNHPVAGLQKADFQLRENGAIQDLALFEVQAQPCSLGVLVDTSLSMTESFVLRNGGEALSKAFKTFQPGDEVFLLPFSDRNGNIARGSPMDLEASLGALSPSRSGTALYDAIAAGLCRLRSASNPTQALIVLTDGADQNSRLSLADVIGEMVHSPAEVYMLGCFRAADAEYFATAGETLLLVTGREVDNPKMAFARLAAESGAAVYFPKSVLDLVAAIDTIQQDLRNRYLLGYYAKDGLKGSRSIEVTVSDRGYRIRSRRGVAFGPGQVTFSESCDVSPTGHPRPYERFVGMQDKRPRYIDGLRDPAGGWPVRENSWYGRTAYHLVRSAQRPAVNEISIVANGPWWDILRAELSVKIEASSGPTSGDSLNYLKACAGLAIHVNERGCYFLAVCPAGHRVYAKLSALEFARRSSVDIVPWRECERPPLVGGWQHVAVVARDGSLTAEVNGLEFCSVRDRRYLDGYVGLVLGGSGHALYQDLHVEAL